MVVVVLGGVNMDFIVHSRRLAAPGETREGERFDTTPGGKGANQAVAAARLLEGRVPVEMAGLLGEDPYSPRLRGYLRSAGVGTSQLATAPGAHCGIAVILIDSSGENRVNAVYGANLLVRPEHGVAASRLLPSGATEPPAVLLVQHEVPLEATRAAMTESRLRRRRRDPGSGAEPPRYRGAAHPRQHRHPQPARGRGADGNHGERSRFGQGGRPRHPGEGP